MDGLIGVFGGTFDPPHHGHLILADLGRDALGLDRVFWVLTPAPPHKPNRPHTAVEDRLAMVEAAIEGNPEFELSQVDLLRPPPQYSVGTMEGLRKRFPKSSWVYLMGADSLRDLPTWHLPLRFLELCDGLGIMRRPNADFDLESLESMLPGIKEKVHFFQAPHIDISGHDIRRRVREGKPYRYLVPARVAEIIDDRRLYI